MNNASKVIVALDYADIMQAEAFVEKVSPEQCRLKVGKELFTLAGPVFVDKLVKAGFDVFLDLKFHDIPNTVAKAVARAADLGVWMTDLHASGGRVMMEAARKELALSNSEMLLIAVTVLTSMDQSDLRDIGIDITPEEQVVRLARLAQQSGMDGVVSSAREAPLLRDACGAAFKLVTPGVRLTAESDDDQKRVLTPVDAIRSGSSYLVIGRPITQAEDPISVLLGINQQIG